MLLAVPLLAVPAWATVTHGANMWMWGSNERGQLGLGQMGTSWSDSVNQKVNTPTEGDTFWPGWIGKNVTKVDCVRASERARARACTCVCACVRMRMCVCVCARVESDPGFEGVKPTLQRYSILPVLLAFLRVCACMNARARIHACMRGYIWCVRA